MPYKIQFFVAGDEYSKSLVRTLDRVTRVLAEKFGSNISSSYKDFITYVLISNVLRLPSKMGTTETFEIETFFVLEIYHEEIRLRYDLTNFPAIRVDGQLFTGQEAVEFASKLYTLFNRFSDNMYYDELVSEIKGLIGREVVAEDREIVGERMPIASRILQRVGSATKAASRISSSLVGMIQARLSPPKEMVTKESVSSPPADVDSGRVSPDEKPIVGGNFLMASISECLIKLEKLRQEGRISEDEYEKMKEIYNSFLR